MIFWHGCQSHTLIWPDQILPRASGEGNGTNKFIIHSLTDGLVAISFYCDFFLSVGDIKPPFFLWREKTDKEKSHKGIWRSGCPGGVPGTNSGRPRDTWDIWAWFMCKSILKGQNVPGTDGTYHGTDGTCPRDRRDAHQGVSRQNSLCLLVFFFPDFWNPEGLGESHHLTISGQEKNF